METSTGPRAARLLIRRCVSVVLLEDTATGTLIRRAPARRLVSFKTLADQWSLG